MLNNRQLRLDENEILAQTGRNFHLDIEIIDFSVVS